MSYIYDSFNGTTFQYDYTGPYLRKGDIVLESYFENVIIKNNGTVLTQTNDPLPSASASNPVYKWRFEIAYNTDKATLTDEENGITSLVISYVAGSTSGSHTIRIPNHVIKLTDFKVKYKGSKVGYLKNYDINDLEVTINHSIDGKKILKPGVDFTVSSLNMSIKEDINTFTVFYIADTNITAQFEVPCVFVTNTKAEYTGDPVLIKTPYDSNKVIVSVEYNYSEYNINPVPSSEYILSPSVVNVKPFQSCYAHWIDKQWTDEEFNIPFQIPVLYIISIEALYNGPPYHYIISDYDPNDVTVTAIYNLSEYNRILKNTEYTLSSTTVNICGANNITVTLIEDPSIITYFDVIGARIVLNIHAEYVGDPVEVSENVNPNDIIVYLDTCNPDNTSRQTIILAYNKEYKILSPGLLITQEGNNLRTIQYQDAAITSNISITFPGIAKLIRFETVYISSTKLIGETVSKTEIDATAICLIDISGHIKANPVSINDWDFYDSPIINEINKGFIRTVYKEKFFSDITVPYDKLNGLYMLAWYEGPKIQVKNIYNCDNVVVLLIYENGNRKRLSSLDVVFSDTIVHLKGWNYYYVTYKKGNIELKQWFGVQGYIPIVYSKHDFKVVYIDKKNNFREIDYTERFRDRMTYMGVFSISWKAFLSEVTEMQLYGLYVMTAPKLHGLSPRWDEDWDVLCFTDHTLKASILHTYLCKEEPPCLPENPEIPPIKNNL